MKKFFLFVYSLLLAIYSIGQQAADSTHAYDDSKKLKQFQHFPKNNFWSDSIQSSGVDTTLDNFFYYSPQFYNFKMNLGNNGTAQRNLFFNPNIQIGFKTSFDQLHDFKFNFLNNEYYDVTQPYARVYYVNGAQKEEGINIAFSQNISKNWNIGIEYKKVSSEGFYQRQRTAINNFRVFQSFKSKNNRYAVLANLNYNDNSNEENGGIKYDTVFTEFPELSRKGIEVNYTQAKNSGRNQEYYLEQQLNFGKEKTFYFKDENDSIHQDSILGKWISPILSPFHAIRYNHAEYHFDDVSTSPENYPPGSVLLGGNINDYLSTKELDNRVGFEFFPLKNSKLFSNFEITAFGEFQYLEYLQTNHFAGIILNEKYLTNTLLGLKAFNQHQKIWNYGIEFLNTIDGYDSGDQMIKGYLNYSNPKYTITANVENSSINPDLFFRDYSSITYQWNTTLNKTQANFIEGSFCLPKLGFGINTNFRNVTNHTYLNSKLEVRQYDNPINIWQTQINQHFKVWKLHLDLNLRYQWVDQSGVINVPQWLGYGKLYLESKMFKNELLYRIGLDLYANASYNADGYNPTLRRFYSQTNTLIETVPWGEFYIMANVDRAYFFVRVSNVFEGAIPYNYFASPGYPLPDRALKFGIKWEFVN